MRSIFTLTEEEEKSAEKFETDHRHPEIDHGCIGGHLTYLFTVTSIGTGISIRCSDCDADEDITDYSTW